MLIPTETFRAARPDTLGEGLKYGLVWLVIFGLLAAIIFTAIWAMMSAWLGAISPVALPAAPGIGLAGLIFIMVIAFGLISFIIGGAWQHLWVRVCGGMKGYTQTVKAIVYGATPGFVLGWIPFVGIIGAIWSIVVTILGLRELHEISTGRAVAAYLLSVAIIGVIYGVIIVAILL